mmetsp:Transcript_24820/g.68113  ORF Transcript_24820/g.68113 Transcript_24820/m.68113 type:complete len:304 (+) Transcript_24820:3-914(+)
MPSCAFCSFCLGKSPPPPPPISCWWCDPPPPPPSPRPSLPPPPPPNLPSPSEPLLLQPDADTSRSEISWLDPLIIIVIAAAIICFGVRYKRVLNQLREREQGLSSVRGADVEMAEESDSDEVSQSRHRSKSAARVARDRQARRAPRRGRRTHGRLPAEEPEEDQVDWNMRHGEHPDSGYGPSYGWDSGGSHSFEASPVASPLPERFAGSTYRERTFEEAHHTMPPPSVDSIPSRASHYDVLGVGRDASDADLKRAFHRLSRKYHPDKSGVDGSAEMFLRVKEAYRTLSDSARRRDYNFEIGGM